MDKFVFIKVLKPRDKFKIAKLYFLNEYIFIHKLT